MRPLLTLGALGLLLVYLTPSAAVGQEQSASPRPSEQALETERLVSPSSQSITLKHLTPDAIQTLVRRVCEVQEPEECRILGFSSSGGPGGGTIRLSALPQTLIRISEALTRHDVAPRQTLQVALIHAGVETSGLGGLTSGARQALQDASRLLPYESFSLTGVGLLNTTSVGETTITGPGGTGYQVQVRLRPILTLESAHTVVDFELARSVRIAEAGQAVRHEYEDVLSSTFNIVPDETVVVGASRLDGGDQGGLVVLVTAIPEGAHTPR